MSILETVRNVFGVNTNDSFPVPPAPGSGLEPVGDGNVLPTIPVPRPAETPPDPNLTEPSISDRLFNVLDNTFDAGLDILGNEIDFQRQLRLLDRQAQLENIRDDRLVTGTDTAPRVPTTQAGFSPQMALLLVGGAVAVGLLFKGG